MSKKCYAPSLVPGPWNYAHLRILNLKCIYFAEKIGGCIATGWQFPPQPKQLHSMADRDREDSEQSTAGQSPARTCHSTDRGPKGNRIVYSVLLDWKLYS